MFVITSPAFADGEPIPSEHTCEGADTSPALVWSGAPAATRSFALIVDDPDAPDPRAPKQTWVHWVLYNLPSDTHALPADAEKHGLPEGTCVGINDSKHAGYGGPCPPIGRHRYFHKLFALDTVLPDLGHPTKDRLLSAMRGHILAQAQIIGTYAKEQ